MASSLINGTSLDAATLLAILLERAGGDVTIPEDAAIAMIDRNADVVVFGDGNGSLHYQLKDKSHG